MPVAFTWSGQQGYGRCVGWLQAAGWGLAGGLAAGLLALMTAVSTAGFRWPWKSGELGPRLFVFAGGLILGALVAAAAHGDMTGGWPAFVMGAGAPATIRGLLSGVQVSAAPQALGLPDSGLPRAASGQPEAMSEGRES